MATEQKQVLNKHDFVKSVKKTSEKALIEAEKNAILSPFDKSLDKALSYNPHKKEEPSE